MASFLAIGGCGPVVAVSGSDTDGETETDTDDTGTQTSIDPSTSVGPSTTTMPPPPPCATVPLGPPPATIVGTSAGEVDSAQPSCSPGNGPDSLVQFTAPVGGVYVFDTMGSAIDTVLYAFDGDCTGPELACNDDTTDMTSSISLPLVAGQSIVLVVDTFGVAGDWVLTVTGGGTGMCPDEDLGPLATPWTRASTTVGGTSEFGSLCGGQEAPENTYTWQAPHAGTYTFDTFGSALDTILYVVAGECTYDPVLECNDDVEFAVASGVVVDLNGGETVTAVVDGVSGVGGDYVLTVDRIVDDCPQAELSTAEPPFQIPTSTTEQVNTGGSACGGWFARDRSWRWLVPADGVYEFRAEGEFLPVLSIKSADCGEELACASAPGETTVALDLPLQAGESIVIQVDGQGHAHGETTVHVAPTTCPELELGMVAMVDTAGTNAGASDTLEPGCAPGGADWVFGWTAPATATYEISTVGSDFDTVLSVREGSCLGEEIACDDDGGGDTQSLVVVDAVAGQTYAILLDGYAGSLGDYRLTISP